MKIRQGFAALPVPHPSTPSLFFLFSGFLARQMRGRGSQHPYIGWGGPAAPQPGGRFPGTCPQICFLFFLQISTCRPAAGRPGPGRPAAGRPAALYKVCPVTPIWLTKNLEKKKREGGRGGVRERQSGEVLSDFKPATLGN